MLLYISALSYIAAVSLGSFLGGVLSRKIDMSPQITTKCLVIFNLVNVICLSSGFFLGCNQPALIGDNGKGFDFICLFG